MNQQVPATLAPVEGPATEVAISKDMIRRGLIVAPLIVSICGAIWGLDGVYSAAYGIAIVLVNFALAALFIAVSARISLGLMMGAVLLVLIIAPQASSQAN